MHNDTRFYIDGRWQDRPDAPRIAVVDPFTERVVGHVAAGSAADVDGAVAAARRGFERFSRCSVDERLALLDRIVALLEARAEAFAQALVAEMGAAIGFARAAQVPFAIEHVRVQIEVLRRYSFLTRDEATGTITAKEPIGVCALITPWNWPLYQVTAKVAPAIAAGCSVVLKPSELSPFSALLFAQVMHDAGVPAGVFNLVGGTGEVVGAALAAHPDVDMISITGSTRAGVLVAQAAAVTVKRVVQELGGKSPNVFLDDADFEQGVPKGVLAGMRNVGQSCSAPTRLLVPAARLSEVEALAAQAAAGIRVGDPHDDRTTMGPIANAAQFARVQQMIEAGIDDGARLIAGGPGRPTGLEQGFFARPTIFSDVTRDMRIAREEIFGPVLVLMPYRDEEDAIAIANDTVYGLGAHLQSSDSERARRVAGRIRAGQVHINYPAWNGHAPFGGYKRSGNGREYGVHGLEEYLETKAIVVMEPPTSLRSVPPEGAVRQRPGEAGSAAGSLVHDGARASAGAGASVTLQDLDTPCLVLDATRMERNVARLRDRLATLGVGLRPHLKTGKSVEVARRVMDSPQGPATVSTLQEAAQFAAVGVRDIVYAVGIAPAKLGRVLALRAEGVDLVVLLDTVAQAEAVAAASRNAGSRIPALIEIDCDGHRSGVRTDETESLVAIGRALQRGAELRGVLTHAGGSYTARGADALRQCAEDERQAVVSAATALREAGLPCPVVSVGSTPTAHHAANLAGVTEVRAGVFVFFDLVMAGVGVCQVDDIALSVLATVIGHQRDKGWILIDAGWMAMSQDRGTSRQAVNQGYGVVCDLAGQPYPDLIVGDANQEHGIVTARPGSNGALPDLAIGDRVRILPNHACATAAQHHGYHVVRGADTQVVAEWPRFRGW